jgi:hypothetical protein
LTIKLPTTVPLKALVETADADVAETAARKTVQHQRNHRPKHHVHSLLHSLPTQVKRRHPLQIKREGANVAVAIVVARRRDHVLKAQL